MPTLTPASISLELLVNALNRAFVQIADLPISLLPELVCYLRCRFKFALIDACQTSEIPGVLQMLLQDLLTDLDVLDAHRIAILDFVSYELSFLFNGSLEEE